jgi:glucose-6-phosphate 1-dehydrogenase
VETFALQLEVDSSRWKSVPFHTRAGTKWVSVVETTTVPLRRLGRFHLSSLESHKPARGAI